MVTSLDKATMKVGLVGYGKMGRIRESVIAQNPHLSLAYVYDPSVDHCDGNYLACNSFDELIQKGDCEIVFLAGYVKDMANYAARALRAGKHVFSEKPPAKNAQELYEVLEAHKKSNRVLKYGFNHRYHHSVQKAKKIVDAGTLGKPLFVRAVYGKAGSIDFESNWRNYKEYSGGGILIDQGIHILDLICFLTKQSYVCKSAIVRTQKWNIEAEDNVMALLESSNGVIASAHSSATQWKHKFFLEIGFEEGYLVLDGILSSTMSYAPERLCVGMRASEDINTSMGQPVESWFTFEKDDSWKMEVQDFVRAILEKNEPESGTIKDGIAIMELIDQIYGADHDI